MTCFVPACFWSVCGYSARAVPTEVTPTRPAKTTYQYDSTRTDKTGFTRHFKIYTCEYALGRTEENDSSDAFRSKNRRHLSKMKNRCGTSFWIFEGEFRFHSIFTLWKMEGLK